MDKKNCDIFIAYYSAIKRNELLVHATIWMNVKIIVLNERNRQNKSKYCMTPFTYNSRK